MKKTIQITIDEDRFKELKDTFFVSPSSKMFVTCAEILDHLLQSDKDLFYKICFPYFLRKIKTQTEYNSLRKQLKK